MEVQETGELLVELDCGTLFLIKCNTRDLEPEISLFGITLLNFLPRRKPLSLSWFIALYVLFAIAKYQSSMILLAGHNKQSWFGVEIFGCWKLRHCSIWNLFFYHAMGL